jgi:hypothetical protein
MIHPLRPFFLFLFTRASFILVREGSHEVPVGDGGRSFFRADEIGRRREVVAIERAAVHDDDTCMVPILMKASRSMTD